MSADATQSFDAIIAGAGMIGSTMAVALARQGLEVALIDRLDPALMQVADYDGRVSSIAYGSHAMLAQLGLWDHVAGEAEPILDIRVSDRGSPFYLHFDHREVGERPFGFMVENRFLRAALAHELTAAAEVKLFAPAEIADVVRGSGRVEVSLSNGALLTAPLLIGADGRNSSLREAAGIRQLRWRYPQTAIVCVVGHELPHHNVATEHFLPAGPLALLPMRGLRSALVWTEAEDLAPALLDLGAADFDAEIQTRAGDHWGQINSEARRWSYPLSLQNAERYTDRRLALIGDAAHAMHPIAGQGLNLGLRDVACLAEVLWETVYLGLDPGGASVLERYQRWRRFDALTMLVMTDGLNRLFSTDLAALRLARDLGLGVVNGIGPLKRFFERRAAAMAGDLPKLIRGEALAG